MTPRGTTIRRHPNTYTNATMRGELRSSEGAPKRFFTAYKVQTVAEVAKSAIKLTGGSLVCGHRRPYNCKKINHFAPFFHTECPC